ncbi:hypothetical protein KXV57_008631 [Aspergillus fumigatus]|uniref:ubiquitinyl hydrolase 1 n=1 Tax=Aspergillus fumigatus TaxID=746128 RepID=A0A9P8N9Q1_ASPFM|nr:hypothetical protein KXV57_008631 [Aspergillus fumigatus]
MPFMSSQKMCLEANVYLVHHVFLPPKLPQEDDYDPEYELVLLEKCIEALEQFKGYVSGPEADSIAAAALMITRLAQIFGPHGDVDEKKFRNALAQLYTEGGILPVYVKCQNAAVLMTRDDDAIRIETFELSARNEAVMTTIGRLKRQFPGPTLSMDLETFNESGLQTTIAQTFAKLSHQPVAGTHAKVKKAGQMHDEDRDTTHPRMVTEFVTAFLRPLCTSVVCSQMEKNTREEVMWLDSRSPWRRSSLWLLIRVALQLVLHRRAVREETADDLYKQFMVYFMSRIVSASPSTICSEHLHTMISKISRRLVKLGTPDNRGWIAHVREALKSAIKILEKRWHKIIARNGCHGHTQHVATLDFGSDIYYTLPELDNYLAEIDQRRIVQAVNDFLPQSILVECPSTDLPLHLDFTDPEYKAYNLAAFEHWVACSLETWLETHISDEGTCNRVGTLLKNYYEIAITPYASNPEALSVMLLTVLELWIACDKSATRIHQILWDYDACIPVELFESLLLPFRSQMARLDRAESYLRLRKQRTIHFGPGVFQDYGTPACFAVRYFDQSETHQRLLSEIEESAWQEREDKKAELRRKRQQCADLYALCDTMDCTYEEVIVDRRFNFRETRHSGSCQRCAYQRQADSMKVSVHEWPLPSNRLQAKSTVFELNVPRPFGCWRDITMFFLVDVLHIQYISRDEPRAEHTLQNYGGLSPFYTAVQGVGRVGLLSQNKPHERTHRLKKKIINVTEDDVCVNNGLLLRYFDFSMRTFVGGFKMSDEIANLCMYKLPKRSTDLQQFLFRPLGNPDGPSPNTVIASQDCCPVGMSLEEYRSLCTMPLGVEIQWQNILRQLAMPSIDLKKAETCIFILQIINQAGPSTASRVTRTAHDILNDTAFTTALLGRVYDIAARLEENWEMAQGLSALSALVLRILALSPSADVREICLTTLQHLRKVAFAWVKIVTEKASSTTDDRRRSDLLMRSGQLALICATTFDAEDIVLVRMLENPSDTAVLLQCCMLINDTRRFLCEGSGSSPLIPILFRRWQVLCYRCLPVLRQNILQRADSSLDIAIGQIWVTYRAGSSWKASPEAPICWLVTSLPSQSEHGVDLPVHYNLLTGDLLVNGLPLARLPSEYERHDTYRTLFGQSSLEVMPSVIPGMDFTCRKKYMGHTVSFSRRKVTGCEDFDLCIQATEAGCTWEFIPPRLLMGSFPDAFLTGCVHWLRKTSAHDPWRLAKDTLFLVSVKSRTAEVIAAILQPIEKPSQLHCTFDSTTSSLGIELPRLRLRFTLQRRSSAIRSREYQGMFIDPDQSLDALVGLRNRLILRHESGGDRVVLIPEGRVTWLKDHGHIAVEIGWQARSTLHPYTVDDQLGRLTDNDPLTGRTGTEQALTILRSASMRSFDRLHPKASIILAKIAELTPERHYYPSNERVMQTVRWDKHLGFLAQHDSFYREVTAIFDHDNRMKMFHPNEQVNQPPLPHIVPDLLRRNEIRSSSFRVAGFGAEAHTVEYDRPYKGLDQNRHSARFYRAYRLCKILYEGIPSALETSHVDLLSELWQFLSQTHVVHAASSPVDSSRIQYDAGWILEPMTFVASHWCSLHQLLCSRDTGMSKFQVMVWLATLAFSESSNMVVLEVLASLYVIPEMANPTPASRGQFQLWHGYEVNEAMLGSRIHQSAALSHTPESNLHPRHNENMRVFRSRKKRIAKMNRTLALQTFIRGLKARWPIRSPATPPEEAGPRFGDYYATPEAMTQAGQLFQIWFDNLEFREYLSDLSSLFVSQTVHHVQMPPVCLPGEVKQTTTRRGYICIDDLLGFEPMLDMERPRLSSLLSSHPECEDPAPRLMALVDSLERQSKSQYERRYVEHLRGSIGSLQQKKRRDYITMNSSQLEAALLDYLHHCETYCERLYDAMRMRLTHFDGTLDSTQNSLPLETLAGIGNWPRISPYLLVEQLTHQRWYLLPERWKASIVEYGCAITALQRARRLTTLVRSPDDLIRELQNPGHTNWDPYQYPESLLLEIENSMLIREVQEQIARRMRDISPGTNAVMQLNMGEGKSSVIVPMVVAHLADGSRLVRVVVAKPQSRQMLQMLVSKLGGLLGRPVYLLPVSRSLRLTVADTDAIFHLCQKCMEEGGVLLVQPEHLLSLKMMCLESFVTGRGAVGGSLLQTLEFFTQYAQDVVDESDENFSAKFELIYTMGTQRQLELTPQRWVIVQELLNIMRMIAPSVKKDYPRSLEVEECSVGGFPRIRLLQKDAELELLQRVATHICEHGIDSLPISRQSKTARQAVRAYILKQELSSEEISSVEDTGPAGFWTETTKNPLLLLRGLFAGGILSFCFGQKRWRVNYGPDHSRNPPTRLSVPYRAKDCPAPRSEFSHPDVVILLTCLNYYYAGLSDEELFLALDHLVKSDQAEIEYQAWVVDCPSLPDTYRQLGGVNLEDRQHCVKQIFPWFRSAKGAIDYFLAHVVFPRELREFPDKLSASGWDIGELRTQPTVGFSGTNDSRQTLPLSVEQLDLPEQNHMNALVLDYLLRPENSVALSPARPQASTLDAKGLLDMVMGLEPPVQVILDVGAQILELSSLEVAEYWLNLIPDNTQTQAVIFVNENDEICVLDRNRRVELLQVSPFGKQLGACLVFLDEAHTRGIDLKLPATYRAAVTLGAGITKDKLVQACMRMRKLGKGQSVVFCIPDEIRFKILALPHKCSRSDIDVADVLCWAVSETWVDIRRSMPLWAAQGKRYIQQCRLWEAASQDGKVQLSFSRASEFLEPESQSLDDRYRPRRGEATVLHHQSDESTPMCLISERCRDFDGLSFGTAQLQEEQERELAPEIEQERQIERPPPAEPKQHCLHADLLTFVSTGILKEHSSAVRPAFEALRNTSAARYLDVSQFPPGLRVTTDFATTIQFREGSSSLSDAYQRPVQWVLTHSIYDSTSGKRNASHVIIISPYEAMHLLPEVRRSTGATIHLYAPRQHLSFVPLDRLDLYNIPSRADPIDIPDDLKIQLNLFAGQLYIASYDEYLRLCDTLGVASAATPDNLSVAADGFILRGNVTGKSTFSQSPLKFLQVLLSQIRKDGQDISKTHIGKLLDGRLLEARNFDSAIEELTLARLSIRSHPE